MRLIFGHEKNSSMNCNTNGIEKKIIVINLLSCNLASMKKLMLSFSLYTIGQNDGETIIGKWFLNLEKKTTNLYIYNYDEDNLLIRHYYSTFQNFCRRMDSL